MDHIISTSLVEHALATHQLMNIWIWQNGYNCCAHLRDIFYCYFYWKSMQYVWSWFSLSHLLLNLPHLPNHFLHIFFFSPPLENKHVNKQTNELEKKTDRGRKEGREEKERQWKSTGNTHKNRIRKNTNLENIIYRQKITKIKDALSKQYETKI